MGTKGIPNRLVSHSKGFGEQRMGCHLSFDKSFVQIDEKGLFLSVIGVGSTERKPHLLSLQGHQTLNFFVEFVKETHGIEHIPAVADHHLIGLDRVENQVGVGYLRRIYGVARLLLLLSRLWLLLLLSRLLNLSEWVHCKIL